MVIRCCFILLLTSWILVSHAEKVELARMDTANLSLQIPIKSWKTLRDKGVVKQDTDSSCGAASISTILNNFYGQSITEKQILNKIETEKQHVNFTALIKILTHLKEYRLSKTSIDALMTQVRQPVKFLWVYTFEDMVNVLHNIGFKAHGVASSWEQLIKLKIPVIVYTQHRKTDHFSVIRGIDKNTVWLADPSLGNRTYSRGQFLAMWNTRKNTQLKGKVLIILPDPTQLKKIRDINIKYTYFTKAPMRQTQSALKIMQNLQTF